MLPITEVKRIVKKEIERLGYGCKEIESKSTTSVYYKIYFGEANMIFRIADHRGKQDIITLRIDKKTTPETIKQFAKNRIKDLTWRKTKMTLGL